VSEAELTPAAVAPRIAVRCESWREFAERYADDIASGGMYLSHASPPAVLSLVEVVLQLPEATEIALRARVVQVLSADQAASMGKPPGMGLELLDIDAERKRQVMQLIEFARWQGASGDPKSSFARTLLEVSPSMPAAEVGYRLSMLPEAPKGRSDSRPSIPAQTVPTRAPSGPIPQRAEAAAAALRRSLTPPGGRNAVRESSAPRRPDSAAPDVRPSSMPPVRSSRPPQPAAAGGRASKVSLPAAKTSHSSGSLPAVSTAGTPPARARRVSSASLPAANGGERPSRVPDAPPPKPTDKRKLKAVLTHVAHKHYEEAIRATREMLDDNPGDPEAMLWQALSCARLALQREDDDAALTYYEQIMRIDPEHREAREFVRTHQRDKKLNSIPFGRYFTTKKK
jgi:hypothetical protein